MLSFKHINFISPFHGKGSTVSRLQGHYEGTVYFNYQVPRISYHSFTPQSHLGHCPRDSLHHDVNHWKFTYFDQDVTGYLNSKGSLKKRRHRCFPMIFTIFFKTIFLCNTREQVLLVIAPLNRNLNWFPLREVYRSLKIKNFKAAGLFSYVRPFSGYQAPKQGLIQRFSGDTVFWNGTFFLPTSWLPRGKKITGF